MVHAYNSPDSWPFGSGNYLDWTEYLRRDSTAATSTATTIWNGNPPNATVINIGSSAATNNTGKTWRFEAYHSVEGFSKFGVYLGTNNTDGPFCYTGFRPKWVLLKRVDGTAGWPIGDTAREPYNPIMKEVPSADRELGANAGDIYYRDFVSNGFKLRTSSASYFNNSGAHYIWIAFAEFPFKYTNAH